MPRLTRLAWLILAVVVLVPAVASAQASIAGVVRDASGAVLPGGSFVATVSADLAVGSIGAG